MSQRRTFPIYTVRYGSDIGCGHQHSYEKVARNCALNLMQAHPTIDETYILRIRPHAKSENMRTAVVETISRQTLTGTTE